MVKYVLGTNAAKWLFIKYLESKNDHSLEKQTAKFCVGHDCSSVKNYPQGKGKHTRRKYSGWKGLHIPIIFFVLPNIYIY